MFFAVLSFIKQWSDESSFAIELYVLEKVFLFFLELIFFSFSGTNADIMKVGGYKLSALEIEAVLLEVAACLSIYINALGFY